MLCIIYSYIINCTTNEQQLKRLIRFSWSYYFETKSYWNHFNFFVPLPYNKSDDGLGIGLVLLSGQSWCLCRPLFKRVTRPFPAVSVVDKFSCWVSKSSAMCNYTAATHESAIMLNYWAIRNWPSRLVLPPPYCVLAWECATVSPIVWS